jgi:hypothetical protein
MATGTRELRGQAARPKVARRRYLAQWYLREAVAEGAKVNKAIGSLLDLRKTNPARYQAILGSDRVLAYNAGRVREVRRGAQEGG